MVKVNVYNKSGSASSEVDLPAVFETAFRPDLIRKAVNSAQANRRQPYGSNRMAGKQQAEHSVRSGRGISRVPRQTQGMKAVFAPNVVGGRRAHPPKVEKDWSEKINRKERALARASALAATADEELVRNRGHRLKEGLSVPVVLADDFEQLAKTKDVRAALEAIGIGDDLTRAEEGKKIRPGRGTMRGRKYKTPKTALLVVSSREAPAVRAAMNLVGVDVTTPENLNTEKLAPGGDAGRLTVFTQAALRQLEGSE